LFYLNTTLMMVFSQRGKDRGVATAQAARDIDLHGNILRRWIKEFGTVAGHAFPGHGQMKPEQLEIDRLRKEVGIASPLVGEEAKT
jgi:transposase-like protein